MDTHLQFRQRRRIITAIILASAMTLTAACAGKRVSQTVGQTGLAVAQAIGAVQTATKQLTDAGAIPPVVALNIQTALLAANTKIAPLPDLLRTIDHLQAAGDKTTDKVDQAIAILEVVGSDMSVVVAGVPVTETTKSLIALIRSANQVVTTTLVQVAKLKGTS